MECPEHVIVLDCEWCGRVAVHIIVTETTRQVVRWVCQRCKKLNRRTVQHVARAA